MRKRTMQQVSPIESVGQKNVLTLVEDAKVRMRNCHSPSVSLWENCLY